METTFLQRGTRQPVMPAQIQSTSSEGYTIYPSFSIASGQIHGGYDSLVDWLSSQKQVVVDGYVGVDWNGIRVALDAGFVKRGLRVNWIDTRMFLKSEETLDALVAPYMGAVDSVWGKVTDLELGQFFNLEELESVAVDDSYDVNIVWGTGALFAKGFTRSIYFDLPKNELLYRVRGGSVFNLGSSHSINGMTTYKRLYFVDWIVLNNHKKKMLGRLDAYADTQWGDTLNWMEGAALSESIKAMATTVFRPRPWFDPGVWGGHWMKDRFTELAREEENYAWSFEIIAPENGVVMESDGLLLEVAFDTLMYAQSNVILGRDHARFEDFFPIRFDFLDTFDGGNLSIQCHPSLEYIQEQFGEKFTQDETYYIMDCKEDAKVFLGFRESVEPIKFREALESSQANEEPLDITQYVNVFDSKKHNFYLIPNQTVHSSGKNNMVLEISATPYIFTFKMYDWLQKDKEGKPRPINIEHGFNNLDFTCKGDRVEQEYISKPYVISEDQSHQLIHYPTHERHYYDVHRLDIYTEVCVETNDQVHVLMLVEGSVIEVEDASGRCQRFFYAETFIVPAGNARYTIRNLGDEQAKVIKAFLK